MVAVFTHDGEDLALTEGLLYNHWMVTLNGKLCLIGGTLYTMNNYLVHRVES